MNHPNQSVFQRSEPPRSEVEPHSGSPWKLLHKPYPLHRLLRFGDTDGK
jgi:hypothetical protein